jgi:hypothetical protein
VRGLPIMGMVAHGVCDVGEEKRGEYTSGETNRSGSTRTARGLVSTGARHGAFMVVLVVVVTQQQTTRQADRQTDKTGRTGSRYALLRCRDAAAWRKPDRTKKKIGKKSILTAPGMPLQALRLNPHLCLGETGVPARWSKTICTQLQIMDVDQPLASRLYARLRNGRRSA